MIICPGNTSIQNSNKEYYFLNSWRSVLIHINFIIIIIVVVIVVKELNKEQKRDLTNISNIGH